MRAIFACGGTGGHIMPALAIADEVKKREPESDILFIGAGGMENEIVGHAGYEIRSLCLSGLSRSSPAKALRALRQSQEGKREAARILSDFRPDIVIGTGGYACYPALSAAARLKIPTAVHESNAMPGLAVRVLSHRVSRIWLNFEEAGRHLPKNKIRVVGNPVRVLRTEKKALRVSGTKRVLSFGGSLGADALNAAVLQLMKAEEKRGDICHLHATGKRNYPSFLSDFQSVGLEKNRRLSVRAFIENMPEEMARADLLICRSGAMSISEAAALGKPAILIPSPNVAGDHQTKNARALEAAGAAVLLPESELTGESLTKVVFELLDSKEKRAALSENIRRFDRPDAGAAIYGEMLSLISVKKR